MHRFGDKRNGELKLTESARETTRAYASKRIKEIESLHSLKAHGRQQQRITISE